MIGQCIIVYLFPVIQKYRKAVYILDVIHPISLAAFCCISRLTLYPITKRMPMQQFYSCFLYFTCNNLWSYNSMEICIWDVEPNHTPREANENFGIDFIGAGLGPILVSWIRKWICLIEGLDGSSRVSVPEDFPPGLSRFTSNLSEPILQRNYRVTDKILSHGRTMMHMVSFEHTQILFCYGWPCIRQCSWLKYWLKEVCKKGNIHKHPLDVPMVW